MIRLVLAHLRSVGDAVGADISGALDTPAALALRAILYDWGAIGATDLPTARLAQEALTGRELYGSARAHIVSAGATPPRSAPGSPARPGGCSPT